MNNTARPGSLLHKLSLITLCTGLSRSALAAPSSPPDRGIQPAPAEPPRFGSASQWVLGLEGIAQAGYSRQQYYSRSGTTQNGQPAKAKSEMSMTTVLALDPRVGVDSGSPGTFRTLGAGLEALATFTPHANVVLSAGPWLTKALASGGDTDPYSSPPEDNPPAFGLTFGAGLVL